MTARESIIHTIMGFKNLDNTAADMIYNGCHQDCDIVEITGQSFDYDGLYHSTDITFRGKQVEIRIGLMGTDTGIVEAVLPDGTSVDIPEGTDLKDFLNELLFREETLSNRMFGEDLVLVSVLKDNPTPHATITGVYRKHKVTIRTDGDGFCSVKLFSDHIKEFSAFNLVKFGDPGFKSRIDEDIGKLEGKN